MAKDSSFDIVSRVDQQEVKNAIDQAKRELANRYDFKGSASDITHNVRRQTAVLKDAVEGTDCTVLFGLASYGQGFRSHNPRAENLSIGIRALRTGLESNPSENFEGLSIFADYTTSDEEWKEYLSNWR